MLGIRPEKGFSVCHRNQTCPLKLPTSSLLQSVIPNPVNILPVLPLPDFVALISHCHSWHTGKDTSLHTGMPTPHTPQSTSQCFCTSQCHWKYNAFSHLSCADPTFKPFWKLILHSLKEILKLSQLLYFPSQTSIKNWLWPGDHPTPELRKKLYVHAAAAGGYMYSMYCISWAFFHIGLPLCFPSHAIVK